MNNDRASAGTSPFGMQAVCSHHVHVGTDCRTREADESYGAALARVPARVQQAVTV